MFNDLFLFRYFNQDHSGLVTPNNKLNDQEIIAPDAQPVPEKLATLLLETEPNSPRLMWEPYKSAQNEAEKIVLIPEHLKSHHLLLKTEAVICILS